MTSCLTPFLLLGGFRYNACSCCFPKQHVRRLSAYSGITVGVVKGVVNGVCEESVVIAGLRLERRRNGKRSGGEWGGVAGKVAVCD